MPTTPIAFTLGALLFMKYAPKILALSAIAGFIKGR